MLTGIICVWSETVKFALTFDVHKNMEVFAIDVICSQIPLLILVTHSSFNFLLIKSFWRQKEKKLWLPKYYIIIVSIRLIRKVLKKNSPCVASKQFFIQCTSARRKNLEKWFVHYRLAKSTSILICLWRCAILFKAKGASKN